MQFFRRRAAESIRIPFPDIISRPRLEPRCQDAECYLELRYQTQSPPDGAEHRCRGPYIVCKEESGEEPSLEFGKTLSIIGMTKQVLWR